MRITHAALDSSESIHSDRFTKNDSPEGRYVRLGLFSEDKHLKFTSRCRQGKTFVILKRFPISLLQGETPHPSKYIPSIGEMLGEKCTLQTVSADK